MKRRLGLAGFTIVETMIVLAVTGALFVSIAVTLGGRQRTNEFTLAINDVKTQIQEQISQVQAGYYPQSQKFTCTSTGLGPAVVADLVGNVEQGAHGDCVFLGKAFQFAVQGTDPQLVRIYTVVGVRSGTSIVSAQPTAVQKDLSDNSIALKYGLTVTKMQYTGGGDTGTFAVLNEPLDTAVSDSANGNTQLDIYGLTSPEINQLDNTDAAVTSQLRAAVSSASSLNPDGGIKICFKSGTTDQYGLLTVGQGSRQLGLDLQIMSGSHVGCDLP